MSRKMLSKFVLFLFAWVVSAGSAEYDLIIRNGKIVDGTGNPWFLGDVAVASDRIAAVGVVNGPAKRVINAAGLIVCPGFIDIHSHSEWVLLNDGDAQSKIRQGVTTEVVGEANSPGPFQGTHAPRRVWVNTQPFEIRRLRDYFAALETSGTSVNVASYAGQGQVWTCVMGNSFERPGPQQMQAMKELVDEAMRDGAFGLSTALMMPPSSLATTDDLIELCSVVKKHGGIYSTHTRDEGLGVFDSITEAIRIAEKADIPVDIIHLKIADKQYWGRMDEVVSMIERARQRGANVQANVYPYTRGNNSLHSIIPPWAYEGGLPKTLERLKDPVLRERIKHDIKNGVPGWYNHYTAVGGDWSRMLINGDNAYKGMTMDRVIAKLSEGKNPPPDPVDIMLDLIAEYATVPTIFAHHTEKDMNVALTQPWCSIGSDGSALATEGPLRKGNPHPRSFGTFPRVLGQYVRETKLLGMEDAIRKMTSLNASKIGLLDRGTLRPNALADIAIFDPQTITDRATYEDPFQYSEGIHYVLVNGQVVIDKGKHTGARPGRALRHKSRLVPESPVSGQTPTQVETEHSGEGPAWHVPSQSLYFTGGNRITRLDSNLVTHVFREPSGGANGLIFDLEGRLITCEAQNRRITRTELDGSITILADSFEGKKFNSPNDLTIDSKGRIYFTDPRYGPRDTMELRDSSGNLVEGVYRIDAPGKVGRIIAHEVDRPNGVLVSPGDKYLFVADNNNNTEGGARKLWRFELHPDGSVSMDSKKLLFDWQTSRGPDGIKMDSEKRLFVAAGLNKASPPYETVKPHPAGVYILTFEGDLLDFVPIPRDEVTNCAFGGPDLKTLFITAGGTLWSIRVSAPGLIPFTGK